MKNIAKFVICVGLAFCLCLSTSADSSVQNIRDSISILKNADVSYEWANDIISNKTTISNIEDKVTKMSKAQLGELYDIKTEIIGYVSALNEINGEPVQKIENIFKDILPEDKSEKDTSARNSALEIYNSLLESKVSPNWQPDIKENEDRICEMLGLTYNYSSEDLQKVTLDERVGMMGYFKALYISRNYDVLSLETVLTSVTQPLSPGVETPTKLNSESYYQNVDSNPVSKKISLIMPEPKHDDNFLKLISSIIVFSICFIIAALLVIFLKKHDEHKHFRF